MCLLHMFPCWLTPEHWLTTAQQQLEQTTSVLWWSRDCTHQPAPGAVMVLVYHLHLGWHHDNMIATSCGPDCTQLRWQYGPVLSVHNCHYSMTTWTSLCTIVIITWQHGPICTQLSLQHDNMDQSVHNCHYNITTWTTQYTIVITTWWHGPVCT